MKKVLVWSEDNHRAFIDDISYEIRKTLFSEIGMTQKEALVHWYHEITKWDSYSDNYKSALEVTYYFNKFLFPKFINC